MRGLKKIWRRTAWVILFVMFFSICPNNLSIASNNKMIANEEMTEKELSLLLEDLYMEASEEADKVVEELNLMGEEPIDEEEPEEPVESEESYPFNVLDLNEEEYRQWKLNLIENREFDRRFSLYGVVDSIMSNEYIGVKIHTDGLINMGTTGGNPDVTTDDNKDLLYRYPTGTTSFTTVRIDGMDYIFRSDGLPTFNEEGTQAEAIMTIDDITIYQIITFSKLMEENHLPLAKVPGTARLLSKLVNMDKKNPNEEIQRGSFYVF